MGLELLRIQKILSGIQWFLVVDRHVNDSNQHRE